MRSRVSLIIAAGMEACLLLISHTALAQDASPKAPVTYDELTLELSILLKTRADEFFIQGRRDEAADKYRQAEIELKSVRPEGLPETSSEALDLLKADIAYRQILISNHLSFWGGVRSLSPGLPGPLLTELNEETQKLVDSVDEIYRLSEAQYLASLQTANAAAETIEASATSYTQKAKKEIELMQGREARLSRHETLARIQSLQDQRKALEAEMEKASAALKKAQDSVDKAVLAAASSYAGIPPQAVNAAITGNTRALVTSLVMDSEFLASPELANAAQQLTASGTQLATAIKFYGEARDAVRDVETARRMLRDPTPGNLLKLGEAAWARLPADKRASIQNSVAQQATVRALTSFLLDAEKTVDEHKQKYKALHAALADAMSRQEAVVAELETLVSPALTAVNSSEGRLRSEVEAFFSTLAKEAGAADSILKEGADAYLRIYAQHFVTQLPENQRRMLRQQAGVGSDDLLVKRLTSRGLQTSRSLSVANGKLVLLDNATQVILGSLPDLFAGARAAAIGVPRNALNSHYFALISNLTSKSAAARERVLLATDPAQLDRAVGKWLADLDPVKRRVILERTRKVLGNQSPSLSNFADELLTKGALGQAAAQDLVGTLAPPTSTNDVIPRDAGTSADEAMARVAAYQALNAAFPGAGAAAQLVVSAIEGMAEMGKQIDNLQRYSEASRQLMKEESQLTLSISPALLQEALANKQYEIAQIQQRAATSQARIFAQVHASAGGKVKDLWTRIKLRRPLVFYRTEQLRQTYDLLDTSYALWVGGESGLNGKLDAMIRENPQNLRFALDSEIDLLGWLNRDFEGSRTDIDRLAQHWEQLRAMADKTIGPDIRGNPPVQIARTEVLSLRNFLTPKDLVKYEKWLSDPSQSLALRFSIDPTNRVFHESMRNIRVIDVGLSAVSKDGRHARITGAMLKHPGLGIADAYDPVDGLARPTRMEVLLPQNYVLDTTAEQIADRSQTIGSPFREAGPRKQLEGYSPYTVWELTLDRMQRNLTDLGGISIALAYGGIPKDQILSESDFLRSLDRAQVKEANQKAFDWVSSSFPVPWRDHRALHEAKGALPLGLDETEASLLASFDTRLATEGRPARGGGAVQQCGTKPGTPLEGCPRVSLRMEAVCRAPAAIRSELYTYYQGEGFWNPDTPRASMNPCESDLDLSAAPASAKARAELANRLAVCAYTLLQKTGLCSGVAP